MGHCILIGRRISISRWSRRGTRGLRLGPQIHSFCRQKPQVHGFCFRKRKCATWHIDALTGLNLGKWGSLGLRLRKQWTLEVAEEKKEGRRGRGEKSKEKRWEGGKEGSVPQRESGTETWRERWRGSQGERVGEIRGGSAREKHCQKCQRETLSEMCEGD